MWVRDSSGIIIARKPHGNQKNNSKRRGHVRIFYRQFSRTCQYVHLVAAHISAQHKIRYRYMGNDVTRTASELYRLIYLIKFVLGYYRSAKKNGLNRKINPFFCFLLILCSLCAIKKLVLMRLQSYLSKTAFKHKALSNNMLGALLI